MKIINFSKMVATGNDFIVIDNRCTLFVTRYPDLAKNMCDRRLGIGADGLVLLEKSKVCDFRMRIFNPDGSEAEMCGNGSRCIALYAKINKIASCGMAIETMAGVLKAKVTGNLVKINMTRPKDLRLGIDMELDKKICWFHYINTGVPHAACFVDDIGSADVFNNGRRVRNHKVFAPKGANVDFVQVKKGYIFIRTYERGVEAETLACGTGAVASAVISNIVKGLSSPVRARVLGGELKIYFKVKNRYDFSDVFLEGEAKEVFKGEIKIQ